MIRIASYTASVLLTALFLALPAGGELSAQASGETPGGESASPADSGLTVIGDGFAQRESWRAGIFLGLNRTIYTADEMTGLPGVPNCCPGFNEGGGLGTAVGAMAETPVNDWLSVGGRLYINTLNGALIHEETEVVDDEGFATEAIFQHRIDADIWATSIEPIAILGVSDDARFFTGLRGDVIVRKLYSQEERLIEPETIVFENGRNVRMESDGTIPNGTSFQAALVFGFRYDFFVEPTRRWVVSPEVSGWYGLTPVVADESWKIHGLRVGFTGQYLSYEQKEIRIEEVISGPLEIEEEISLEEVGPTSKSSSVETMDE